MGHRMTSFCAVAVTPQPRCNLPSDLEIGAPGRKWKQCDSSDQVASSDKRIVTPVCTRIAPNTRPIMLGRVCRRIDTLYMTEMVEMSRYTSNQIAGYLGYGKQPEEVNFELPREMVFEIQILCRCKCWPTPWDWRSMTRRSHVHHVPGVDTRTVEGNTALLTAPYSLSFSGKPLMIGDRCAWSPRLSRRSFPIEQKK